VEVFALEFGSRSADYQWNHAIEALAFERSTLFPEGTSRGRSSGEFRERMDEALDKARPDVVAVPGWSGRGAFTALRWCRARRVPAILMSESNAWDEPRRWMKERVKRLYLRRFAAALVGGRSHAAYLERLGVSAERIFPGYDAVDNRYFARESAAARSARAEVRNRLGLPERFFLASSRFIAKKNLPRLLRAYASYLSQSQAADGEPKAWDLVILGDGPLRHELESLRDQLGLRGRVLLPGFRQYPLLPAYYGLAGAFVHASTTEQWGLVVNEAMASGLPVLVSDRCGCAAELVEDGINGWTFDPTDEDELAALMLRVAELPEDRRAAMGVAGQRTIAHWGPERFAEGLKAAAFCARGVEPRPVGIVDELLLGALAMR
jgi:glycosyltransferase involved in cell wall biosynthesis